MNKPPNYTEGEYVKWCEESDKYWPPENAKAIFGLLDKEGLLPPKTEATMVVSLSSNIPLIGLAIYDYENNKFR